MADWPAHITMSRSRPALLSPTRFMRRIADAPDPLRLGRAAILLLAAGYTIAIAVLWIAGARMTIPAWLPIPDEQYYLVETFFIGPLTIVLWFVAGWVGHQSARRVGGRGALGVTLALLAFAIATSSLATLLPDLITGALFLIGALPQERWLEMTSSGFWQGVVIGYLSLYVIGFAVLFPIAIRVGEGVSRRAAWVIGWLCFAVYQVPYLIVVR